MPRRIHSDELKRQVVKEALETHNTSLVGRKHNLNASVVARWVREQNQSPLQRMSAKAMQSKPELLEDPKETGKALEQNNQLKRLIGEKELEIEILRDLLKKMKIPLPPR